jgi:hypothetical protein
MKITLKKLSLAIAGAGMLTIYGCGGGGGGTAATSTITTPTTLTGVAATGAAFTDAIVTVTDSKGIVVGTSSVIGADGTYSITLLSTAVAPLVLTASRTTADGTVESMVSIIPSSSTTAATVNITPVTNLIASRLSSSGDPTKLAAELAAGTSIVNATTVAAKVLEIQTILAPILTATGTTATDPLGGTFATNGTGYDRLLDSLKVTIVPSSATTANIEVGIKQQLAEGATPTVIQFTSQTAVASIPVIPPITTSTLVPSGTAALIAAHLTQLNACFALPLASRVNSTISSGVATGTAANVIASACRTAFFGDNPANFKSNGNLVGRDASGNGAFSGLFKDGATGLVFSQGTYEFTRQNDDLVIGYKSKDLSGNETFDTFAVRLDTDSKLKQIGNQYDYVGGVTPSHQLREQITLSQEAYSYYSTGFDLNLPDKKLSGTTIYDHVEVTSPRNHVFKLYPVAGRSSLVLQYDYAPNQSNSAPSGVSGYTPGGIGGLGNTSYLRLRSEYVSSTTPATPHPSAKEAARAYFANPANFADDTTISSIPAQSAWKFDYYLASNSSATPDATQYYKTRSRPLTIAELRTQGMMQLDASSILRIQAASNDALTVPYGQTLLPTAAVLDQLTWSVPSGALAPTTATLFGLISGTSNAFDDGTKFGSTARSTQIPCSYSGSGTNQCSTSVTGAYAATTYMNGISFSTIDATGRTFSKYYNMSKLQ